jgi:hypothetical protein
MALGEAQLVSSLYTPQRLGSIAQKLNDTNRLSAKNARKHTKTRENMRKTRKNTQNRPAIKRKTRKAPDKNSENLRKTRDSCHFYKNHILIPKPLQFFLQYHRARLGVDFSALDS